MRWRILALAAFLASSGAAQADPAPDAEAVANKTLEASNSLLDDVVHGVGDAAEGVGGAAEKAGKGVGTAADAIGHALVAAAKAVGKAVAAGFSAAGHAAVASTRFLAGTGAAASLGLSGALLGAGASVGFLSGALGSSAGSGVAVAGLALAQGLSAVAGLLKDGVLAYVGFVAGLRPGSMSPIVFATVATTGAAASGGIGGWAGWNALRKWGLLGGLGVAGFSRIDDGELLEHPLRQQIFQVIQAHPGIHASGLAREVGVGWGTITHHLEKLEKGSLVATRKVNNQKCFFENGGKVSRQDMAVASAVKGDTAGRSEERRVGKEWRSRWSADH